MSLSTVFYPQPLSVFSNTTFQHSFMQIKTFKSEFHPPTFPCECHWDTTHTALHRAFFTHSYRCFQISSDRVPMPCDVASNPTCGWTNLLNQDPIAGYLACSPGGFFQV